MLLYHCLQQYFAHVLHMCCTCVNVLNCPCAVMFVGNCFSTPCWRNVAHVLHMCCTCVSVLKYPCARQKLKKNQVFCTCVHVICTCAHVNAHVPYMWIHVHMCRTFLYMGILTSPYPTRNLSTFIPPKTVAQLSKESFKYRIEQKSSC